MLSDDGMLLGIISQISLSSQSFFLAGVFYSSSRNKINRRLELDCSILLASICFIQSQDCLKDGVHVSWSVTLCPLHLLLFKFLQWHLDCFLTMKISDTWVRIYELSVPSTFFPLTGFNRCAPPTLWSRKTQVWVPLWLCSLRVCFFLRKVHVSWPFFVSLLMPRGSWT